ncbi:armadillo-type protein [Obelidium mucronatum]|nr:armadillo-type protein [Obelidium mucronatum]
MLMPDTRSPTSARCLSRSCESFGLFHSVFGGIRCLTRWKQNQLAYKQATATLEALKDSPNALQTCSFVLDHSSDPSVQFHIANIIKDIVIRHFSSFNVSDLVSLRGYLMDYMLNHCRNQAESNFDINNATIKKLAHTIVVLVKRCWLDESIQDDRSRYFINLEALRRSGDLFHKHVALNVLDQMLGEFSSEASAFGLPWDFHSSCRRTFEETELPRLFHMVMEALHEYVTLPTLLNQKGELTCARRCVAIAVKILKWEFVSIGNVMAGSFEALDNLDNLEGSGRFPASWTAALIRPEIVETVFKIHQLLLPHDISGNTAKLISHLAAVNGPVFPDSVTQVGFVKYFLELLEGLITGFRNATTPAQTNLMNDPSGDELIALSDIIKRLLSTHPVNSMRQIPQFFNFMSTVVHYTLFSIDCMKLAVSVLSDGEDCAGMVATDVMLEMWASFVDQSNTIMQMASPEDTFANTLAGFLRSLALPIFTSHLEMRLALATKQVVDDALEEEDVMGLDDDVAYADQLDHLTVIARWDIVGCCGLLKSLLEGEVGKVDALFTRGEGAGSGIEAEKTRNVLLEKVHWLILICEHLLADAGEGEVPMVPDALMTASSGATSSGTDVVVSVSNLIFQVLSIFSNIQPGSPAVEFCSPLIIQTLFDFLHRWSKSYLFINPSDYGSISNWIAQAYSANGGGPQLFEFMIISAQQNFTLWKSEESVLNSIIQLLQSFAIRGALRDRMIQSVKFQELIQCFVANIKDMPTSTHSPMIRVLATISTQGSNPELEAGYFYELTGMLDSRLLTLVQRPDFARVFQKEQIKTEVVNTLEMYEGLCLAADYNTASTIFTCVVAYLATFKELFKVYRKVSEVNLYVLRVFGEMAKMLSLHDAPLEERQMFYSSYTEVLKIYSNSNIGVKSNSSYDEDDRFNDLTTVLETLSNLILFESKDEDRYDVVFYGVNMVLPLITAEMLKYPTLSQKSLELVGNVVRHFPSKLLALDTEVLENILSVLRFGTTESAIVEVQKLSFEAITGVVRFCVTEMRNGDSETIDLYPSVDATLQHILDYMLFKEFDPDLIESVGEALYMLVILRHDVYVTLAKQLLDSQPTPERRARLEAAFGGLTNSIERAAVAAGQNRGDASVLNFSEYKLYSEGLVKFLMNVRGFLRVR